MITTFKMKLKQKTSKKSTLASKVRICFSMFVAELSKFVFFRFHLVNDNDNNNQDEVETKRTKKRKVVSLVLIMLLVL